MLSKEYLDTARTILRAAQTMTDQHVAGQLKALAEDYERRAEKAAHADAAKALARSAARGCEGISFTLPSRSSTASGTSSSSRVRSGLRSWRRRTARWSLGTLTGSTQVPRFSNATDGQEGNEAALTQVKRAAPALEAGARSTASRVFSEKELVDLTIAI